MDKLLRELLGNPILVAAIVAAIAGLIKAKSAKAAEEATARRSRPKPEAETSDLETRVRRNFEEMMRRRAVAPPTAPPAAAPQPVAATPRVRRKVVDYDERVRPEPKSTERTRPPPVAVMAAKSVESGPIASRHLEAARKAVAGTLKTAAGARAAKVDRVQDLRLATKQPSSLRRAVLLREILDPPIALRD